jgi:hypothetical protein
VADKVAHLKRKNRATNLEGGSPSQRSSTHKASRLYKVDTTTAKFCWDL